MTKLKMAVIALAGLGLIVAAYAWVGQQPAAVAQTGTAPAEAEKDGVVIAKVNGENVYRSDYDEAFAQLPPQAQQMGSDVIYPLLLDRLVDEKLIGIAADKAISADDAEVVEQMAALRKRIVMQVYFQREIEAKLTDEVLQQRYEQWKEANPPVSEVHARHILLETEEKAKEVLAEVQGGKDFAEAAKEHSTGPSGPTGGDLGFFTHDQMVTPFADAAFAMEPGAVSEAPVKTDFGWHVIKVEERRDQPQPGFDEMRDQLAEQATQEIATEMLAALREGAEVETFDIDGNPMPAAGEESPAADAEQPTEGEPEQPAQQ